MQNETNHTDAVKAAFAKKVRQFYVLNALLLLALIVIARLTQDIEFSRIRFIVLTTIFLLWLFNADKLYRCPNCGEVPRGKQGLIYLPKRCAACDIQLR